MKRAKGKGRSHSTFATTRLVCTDGPEQSFDCRHRNFRWRYVRSLPAADCLVAPLGSSWLLPVYRRELPELISANTIATGCLRIAGPSPPLSFLFFFCFFF
ncbi:hypothetical protein ISCGN_022228 [Ixodes scapularis]